MESNQNISKKRGRKQHVTCARPDCGREFSIEAGIETEDGDDVCSMGCAAVLGDPEAVAVYEQTEETREWLDLRLMTS